MKKLISDARHETEDIKISKLLKKFLIFQFSLHILLARQIDAAPPAAFLSVCRHLVSSGRGWLVDNVAAAEGCCGTC